MLNNLELYRKSLNLKQEEIAKDLNMHINLYRKHERWQSEPGTSYALKYAQYFGCTVEELFELDPEKIPFVTHKEVEAFKCRQTITEKVNAVLLKRVRKNEITSIENLHETLNNRLDQLTNELVNALVTIESLKDQFNKEG